MAEMKLMDALDVPAREVEMEGAEGVTIRWLISKKDGAENFAMRLFELQPGGHTPLHSHGWEHEVYIVKGEGKITCEGEEKDFSEGTFIFVPEDSVHCFSNTGGDVLRFLCIVPAV